MGTIITEQDTLLEIVTKMSRGNYGAVRVLSEMLKETGFIDPDSMLGALTCVLQLDMMGIYGDGIWLLYKDICGEDLVKTIAVVRASQLGFIDPDKVVEAINCHRTARPEDAEIDPDDLLAKVQERLPDFGKAAEEQTEESGGEDDAREADDLGTVQGAGGHGARRQ